MITRPTAGRLIVCDENTNCPEEFFDLRNSKRCWDYPLGRSSISADVAQYSYGCILFGDGNVASWVETDEDVAYKISKGGNTFTKKKLLKLIPPAEVEKVVKVASGINYFIALREDGEVFVWGDEKWKKTPELHPPNMRLQGVVDIDISWLGGLHVLTTEGRVISWGRESNKHPKNLRDIVRIQNTVGISKSGELICWGKDSGGSPLVPIPKKLPKIKEVGVQIGRPSLAITHDGKVRGIGYNHDVIDEELGSLKGKVIQAVGDGRHGCVLLFDDRTIRYFDYSHHFRDTSKNKDLEYAINGQRNILSIGNADGGVWAIQKEGKAQPKKAKTSTSNKKK